MSQNLKLRIVSALVLGIVLAANPQSTLAQFLPGGGVDQNNPSLPPEGVYLSPAEVHAMYSGAGLSIVLSAIQHQPFQVPAPIRTPSGGTDEIEQFESGLQGLISVNGSPNQPANASGQVTTLVVNRLLSPTGTFDTEMLSMNLSGTSPFGPFMIRESPTLASVGQTMITDIGGGMYHIDSFFDVFTELSLDGGMTWMPDVSGPTHVNLLPEPSSVVLCGLGIVAMGTAAYRRRQRS